MSELKKINLLPPEVKSKYENRYIKYFAAMAVGAMLMTIIVQAGYAGTMMLQIKHYNNKNAQYEEMKREIDSLENLAASYTAFIQEYEKSFFPFERFMNNLEDIRPESVHIISIDTPDRLTNEGVKVEENEQKKEEIIEENKNEKQEEVGGIIEYTDDLAGKNIVIRGYGKKQDEISVFIYELSRLPYVSSADITAIEEHKMHDGEIYNIFEVVVIGGAGYEAENER